LVAFDIKELLTLLCVKVYWEGKCICFYGFFAIFWLLLAAYKNWL